VIRLGEQAWKWLNRRVRIGYFGPKSCPQYSSRYFCYTIRRRMGSPRPARASPSRRARVKRYRKRGRYDRKTLDAILDAGVMCHVGFIFDGYPVVIPTLYWRDGDHVYWHGSVASRMLTSVRNADVCLTVTHLDGLVLTRSAFHHSANYRSAVLFGRAQEVEDAAERRAQMERLTESLFPGRWPKLRPVKARELAAARILRLAIQEFSAKVRTGPPQEDERDLDWPVWAGVIPLSIGVGVPEPDDVARQGRCESPVLHKFSRA
jgi:nitroimidazol reductase NimA-like FMN-containing flavoprotein (pyridoxamine 5'-phosphate oxidase superfamily)